MSLVATLQERFATWALRTRPPEETPVVLVQRRVYVWPTRAGLAFGLALVVMLLGSINYNLSLGHALVFLLAGLFVVAILHTFRNLMGLRIDCGRADPVFAGGTAHFDLVLTNPTDHGRHRIRLTTRQGGEAWIDVPAHTSQVARIDIPASRRGWLALPRVKLETGFPLGLIRAWAYAAPAMRCLVYPQPAADAPPLPFATRGNDGLRPRDRLGNDDFANLRRHQASDSPRHIAWKTAARRDAEAPLLAKQFADTGAELLRLDWDDVPSGDAELKLSVLARWIVLAEAEGMVWGLRLPGRELPPGHDDAHLHAALKALALHDIE